MFLIVSIANSLDKTFTYSYYQHVDRGCRVVVPFGKGNRKAIGVVIESSETTDLDPKKIKNIIELVDKKPIYSDKLMDLAAWLSSYYLHPIGEVLRTMLPVSSMGKKLVRKYILTDLGVNEKKLDTDRGRFLKYAFRRKESLESTILKKMDSYAIENGILLAELKQYLCEPFVSFVKQDKVKTRTMSESSVITEKAIKSTQPRALTKAQASVFDSIVLNGIKAKSSKPFLLWGVTGAGKTEIYMQSIQALFDQSSNAQALVLVPEISLTPQMTDVFEERFPGL